MAQNENASYPEHREKIAQGALGALQKEFLVIGKTRVKSWTAWLLIGLAAGITAGILFVADRSGEFEAGRASSDDRGTGAPIFHKDGEVVLKVKEGTLVSPNEFSSAAALFAAEKSFSEKRKLKSLKKVLDKHNLRGETGTRAKKRGLDRIYVGKVDPGTEADAVKELNQDPGIEYAELNYLFNISALPNDPHFLELWGMHNTGQTAGVEDADIDAPEAWDAVNNSTKVVGVIDTGIDYNHEDLSGNVWKNPGEVQGDGVDNDQNGFVDDIYGWDFINNDNDPLDDHGHGTHVAGTIGALGNNGVGVAGVNWDVKMAAIKIFDAGGNTTAATAVKAIQYTNMMGFSITSNSWSGGGFSQALYDVIAAGNSSGYLFVAAAGNNGSDADLFPRYPAAYDLPNIISVAATDHADNKAFFSNYGLVTVDLGAPGVSIFSTLPKAGGGGGVGGQSPSGDGDPGKGGSQCFLCNPSGYGKLSGTSMATPHVSGAAALLWAKKPSLSHLTVKDAILGTVDPIDALDGKTVSGGRLNLNNLFEEDTIPPAAVTDLQVAGTPTHSAVSLRWTATGDDGLEGRASRYDIRYSATPINESNFEAATPIEGEPKPLNSGEENTFQVKGLTESTKYYFALKVFDNLGNPSSLSNIVSAQTDDIDVAFVDNMEKGENGWLVNGTNGKGGPALWHLSKRRSASPLNSWYYGIESQGNYDAGATNWGSITREIDLSKMLGSELRFNHFLATENFPPFDTARVEISSDGGTTWITVWQKVTTGGKWMQETIDISAHDLTKILLRFSFNTLDFLFNKFEGWYVDDVKIVGQKSKNKKPFASIGGPYSGDEDTAIFFDGSKSSDPEGKPLIYKWGFGDGQVLTTTKNVAKHAYAHGEEYTVTLVVNDGAYDSKPVKTKAVIAEINDPPVAQIVQRALVGYAVTFDGTTSFDIDTPITSYIWKMGDGTTLSGRTVTHSYAFPGFFPVTLTVSDGVFESTAVQNVAVSLYDVFDRADSTELGNGWKEISGDFLVSGGGLKSGDQKGYQVAVIPTLAQVSRVSAEFVPESTGGNPRFGLVLRYQDAENYYFLYRALNEMRISLLSKGRETVLAELEVPKLLKGKSFRLDVNAVGNTFILALDSARKISVSDNTFQDGSAGILIGSKTAIASHRADNFIADVNVGQTPSFPPVFPPTPPPEKGSQ